MFRIHSVNLRKKTQNTNGLNKKEFSSFIPNRSLEEGSPGLELFPRGRGEPRLFLYSRFVLAHDFPPWAKRAAEVL